MFNDRVAVSVSCVGHSFFSIPRQNRDAQPGTDNYTKDLVSWLVQANPLLIGSRESKYMYMYAGRLFQANHEINSGEKIEKNI